MNSCRLFETLPLLQRLDQLEPGEKVILNEDITFPTVTTSDRDT